MCVSCMNQCTLNTGITKIVTYYYSKKVNLDFQRAISPFENMIDHLSKLVHA